MTDTPSDSEEFELFAKEMRDVKPLVRKKEKVELQKLKNADSLALANRRLSATTLPQHDPNYLATDHIPRLSPHDVLDYRKPGVQDGVYRKLRLGKYDIDARLDLHRKTLEQARQDVYYFIQDCMKYDLRTVMILHGKGERVEEKALIKSHTAFWLKQMPEVLAYHSAQQHHGGTGAVYILLKKSERKKLETRERLQKRSL